jgi:hypothetical protein
MVPKFPIWEKSLFYEFLVYFVSIWYIFPPFWYVAPKKIWQPCLQTNWRYSQATEPIEQTISKSPYAYPATKFTTLHTYGEWEQTLPRCKITGR